MKVGIVGSRNYPNRKLVMEVLAQEIRPDDIIVTGGARGVDVMAMEFAGINVLRIKILTPINPEKKIDYLFRNAEIIGMSDRLIAFWDGTSRGTKFVIDYARARGKSIKVF